MIDGRGCKQRSLSMQSATQNKNKLCGERGSNTRPSDLQSDASFSIMPRRLHLAIWEMLVEWIKKKCWYKPLLAFLVFDPRVPPISARCLIYGIFEFQLLWYWSKAVLVGAYVCQQFGWVVTPLQTYFSAFGFAVVSSNSSLILTLRRFVLNCVCAA